MAKRVDTIAYHTLLTQLLILPNIGNLKQCQNYCTISLISHPSKIMLPVILNRLEAKAEKLLAEKHACFRPGVRHSRTYLQLLSHHREAPATPAQSVPQLHSLQEGTAAGPQKL